MKGHLDLFADGLFTVGWGIGLIETAVLQSSLLENAWIAVLTSTPEGF